MKTFGRKLMRMRFRWVILCVLAITFSASRLVHTALADDRLTGDYDYYIMVGAAPNGGFEARRRMGFAHFDGAFEEGAWFKRRNGAPLFTITKVTVKGDLITVSLDNGSKIVAVLKGDTIEGRTYRDGNPIDRIWLVKRKEPITWELSYALWPGENSPATFQVTVDPALPWPQLEVLVVGALFDYRVLECGGSVPPQTVRAVRSETLLYQ